MKGLAWPKVVDSSPRSVVQRFVAANGLLNIDGMFEEIAEDPWLPGCAVLAHP